MKKICYFINSDWYFDLHWLERALCTQKSGYQVYIISHFIGSSLIDKFTALGFLCYNSAMPSQSINPVRFILDSLKIFKLIRIVDPDVLHCITIKPCLIGGVYSKLYSKNIVISFVGLGRVFTGCSFKFTFLRKLISPFYNYIFSNKKCLLTFEHENDRSCLVNLVNIDNGKAFVIDGAGVNTFDYSFSPEQSRKLPTVLFASRLLWSKGLDDLIKVKGILHSRGVNFTLNVAGIATPDDPDSIPMPYLEEQHLAGNINWLGKCDNMKEVIENSNIVALPSMYPEGIPRILLEASSVGRAIISYNIGGCGSLVKDGVNGYLINAGDVATLTDKLQYLLENEGERKKMGKNGRELVEKKFCSTIILAETLRLYKILLD